MNNYDGESNEEGPLFRIVLAQVLTKIVQVLSISVVCRKRIEVKKKMKIGHVIGT